MTPPASGTAERSTLRAVGPHLVIAPPDAEAAGLAAALDPVRAEPGTLLLLAAAADAAPVLLGSLDELARTAAARGAGTLVLAASGLAATGPDGRRPAEQLARRTGLTVVAPDAVVSVGEDGTLVAPGGCWWWCRPGGGPAEALGERWPAAATITPLSGGGFWVTAAAPDTRPAVLDRAAAPGAALLLVVGEPDGRLPTAVQLANATALLLDTVGADRPLLSLPWAEPVDLIELAAVLASSLGREVRAAVGLPIADATGHRTVHLAADGTPGWEPYLTELSACPVRRTVTAVGRRTRPGAPQDDGPVRYPAFPGWELEPVAAGLWLHPEGTAARGPRLRRPDPRQPVLLIGDPGRPVTEDVWAHLGGVLAGLPPLGAAPLGPPPGPAPVGPPRLALVVAGKPDVASDAVGRFCARIHGLDWLGPEGVVGPVAPVPVPGPVAPVAPAGPMAPAAPPFVPGPVTVRLSEPPAGAEDVTAVLPLWPEPVQPPAAPGVPAVPPGPVTVATTSGAATTAPATTTAVVATAARPSEPGADGSTAGAEPVPEAATETLPEPVPTPEPAPAPDPQPAAEAAGAPRPGAPEPGATAAAALRPEAPAPLPDEAAPATAAEDRAALVAALGPAYQRWASRADDATTRLPGLRSFTDDDDSRPELVAVLLHHTDAGVPAGRAELAAAARAGVPGPPAVYLRCLAAGLRRLPSHYGGVLAAAPAGRTDLAAYVPGTVLTEPAPVSGITAAGADLGADVGIEFAIWSVGGRRTSAFGEPGEQPTVVFAPGSSFEVVAVEPPDADAGRPARVLLHEVGAIRPAPERLRTWLGRRDAVAPADRIRPAAPDRFRIDLGGAAGPAGEPPATGGPSEEGRTGES
ncbi:hypothetical protein [Streptomyces sp. CB01881]|uniref:hypothetical protein n=1 Tax=Streptomyces sp. CB01881 TaxID=2078691 RepID=UPI000CDBABE0|nr:hypothetical protein [Streptomyces sp. CB01881]AUY52729.1 hypothetical protein C2142_31735 [Streptomyces sp. CB01881]TYC70447.1 hypothetical protein EH183_31800 [Streptomyces sp. CB01881]